MSYNKDFIFNICFKVSKTLTFPKSEISFSTNFENLSNIAITTPEESKSIIVENKHNPKKPFILENVELYGSLIKFNALEYNYTLNNYECFNICLEKINCVASQFINNRCYLYDKNFKVVYNPNETSYFGNLYNNKILL